MCMRIAGRVSALSGVTCVCLLLSSPLLLAPTPQSHSPHPTA